MYDSLYLYISNDYLVFEPANERNGQVLTIHRESQMVVSHVRQQSRQEESIFIYGIAGIVKLHAGDHLVLITGRKKEGHIHNKEIYKITKHMFIPISRSRLHLSESEIRDDDVYLNLLEKMMKSPYHFFSYTYDLTHSLQRQSTLPDVALWQRADDRFFWNKFLCMKLMKEGERTGLNLSSFIIPIICGYISIHSVRLNGKAMTYALMSRRSRFRTGTRYNVRGIDSSGHVANHVETEQIIHDHGSNVVYSYLQTRGSIPLFWTQTVNVKYAPKLEIQSHLQTFDAFRKHFVDQIERYGKQVLVNLVHKHGSESLLAKEYLHNVEMMNDDRIRYLHFDLHKECSNMRWERLNLLVQDMQSDLEEQGFFKANGAMVLRKQTSIVRTNCMDCLDRTNVVQSILGRTVLNTQLTELGVLAKGQTFESISDFEFLFRNVWADNADAISTQYSGTGALKTDFTRTGKRTRKGALQDGLNSMVRYVKNNFLDGSRQDAHDLFHGEFQIGQGMASPFSSGARKQLMLPYLLAFTLAMALIVFVLHQGSLMGRAFYVAFWLMLAALIAQRIVQHGQYYVDKPKLRHAARTSVAVDSDSGVSLPYGKTKKN